MGSADAGCAVLGNSFKQSLHHAGRCVVRIDQHGEPGRFAVAHSFSPFGILAFGPLVAVGRPQPVMALLSWDRAP